MARYRNPGELRDGAAFLKKGANATYTLRRQEMKDWRINGLPMQRMGREKQADGEIQTRKP
jgi:hypothetical protein